MEVESVRLKKTLKTATMVWVEGSEHHAPFHPELLEEIIAHETRPFKGVLEILGYNRNVSRIDNPTTTTTSAKTSNFTKKPILVAHGPKLREGPGLRAVVVR